MILHPSTSTRGLRSASGAKGPAGEIVVVDDDRVVAESISFLLRTAGLGSRICASALELLETHRAEDVDCVVMDIRMPGLSGVEFLEEYVPRPVDAPVILMSAFADVPLAVRAMRLGAHDLFEKPFQPQGLLDTVNRALRKRRAERERRRGHREVLSAIERLTPREREVMHLLLELSSSRRVAEQLGLSTRTVEVHRSRLLHKMNVPTLTQLALLLGRQGLA